MSKLHKKELRGDLEEIELTFLGACSGVALEPPANMPPPAPPSSPKADDSLNNNVFVVPSHNCPKSLSPSRIPKRVRSNSQSLSPSRNPSGEGSNSKEDTPGGYCNHCKNRRQSPSPSRIPVRTHAPSQSPTPRTNDNSQKWKDPETETAALQDAQNANKPDQTEPATTEPPIESDVESKADKNRLSFRSRPTATTKKSAKAPSRIQRYAPLHPPYKTTERGRRSTRSCSRTSTRSSKIPQATLTGASLVSLAASDRAKETFLKVQESLLKLTPSESTTAPMPSLAEVRSRRNSTSPMRKRESYIREITFTAPPVGNLMFTKRRNYSREPSFNTPIVAKPLSATKRKNYSRESTFNPPIVPDPVTSTQREGYRRETSFNAPVVADPSMSTDQYRESVQNLAMELRSKSEFTMRTRPVMSRRVDDVPNQPEFKIPSALKKGSSEGNYSRDTRNPPHPVLVPPSSSTLTQMFVIGTLVIALIGMINNSG